MCVFIHALVQPVLELTHIIHTHIHISCTHRVENGSDSHDQTHTYIYTYDTYRGQLSIRDDWWQTRKHKCRRSIFPAFFHEVRSRRTTIRLPIQCWHVHVLVCVYCACLCGDMYVCMNACMYAFACPYSVDMFMFLFACTAHVYVGICMYVWMHACMHSLAHIVSTCSCSCLRVLRKFFMWGYVCMYECA